MVVPERERSVVRASSRIAKIAVVVALMATLLVAGCQKAGPAFVEKGGSYTKSSVLELLDKTDISAYSSQEVSSSTELRRKALAGLQARGSVAKPAVDLLIETFPADTRGVPVYVELGTVDGKPVTIVIEAVGPKGGKLSTKRLWALDASGTVIIFGTK
jgi:hypothetical protein